MNIKYDDNPIIPLDFPDPDVIRVDDTYYMISTTMHFFPGCQILCSKDLMNWSHCTYVYDKLEDTDRENLDNNLNAYSCGMWAASLRYHRNTFYICFVANDTHKTYLFTSSSVLGPWKKQEIEGFYHDPSLLFDDDKVYIVYSNSRIRITELNKDLTGPEKGGLDRILFESKDNHFLGYEGSHIYKINNKYYVFVIHSLNDRWRRVESCFVSDSLTGDFNGKIIFDDDMGFCNQGIAQGPIVDTPEGDYYAIMFQDRGAVGRIPFLIPVKFENDFPVFGIDGKMPESFEVKGNLNEDRWNNLISDDNFTAESLKTAWQFNHNPDKSLYYYGNGSFSITTGRTDSSVLQAKNTLTQRLPYPGCSISVTVDGSRLNKGDTAGLCILQSVYGYIGLTKCPEDTGYDIIMAHKTLQANGKEGTENGFLGTADNNEHVIEKIHTECPVIRFKADCDFENMKDTASFYYQLENQPWKKIGSDHKMYFSLEHFCGNRAALFCYSKVISGGTALFSDFIISKDISK